MSSVAQYYLSKSIVTNLLKNNYRTFIYIQVLLHTVTVSLVEELEGYS